MMCLSSVDSANLLQRRTGACCGSALVFLGMHIPSNTFLGNPGAPQHHMVTPHTHTPHLICSSYIYPPPFGASFNGTVFELEKTYAAPRKVRVRLRSRRCHLHPIPQILRHHEAFHMKSISVCGQKSLQVMQTLLPL